MSQIRRSPRFVCLVSILALLAGAFPLFAVTVEEIPSPRPNGWSVDLTGTIPADTLQQIDRLGDDVKAANGAEIAVVVIDSTGGVPSHDFAVRLANHWGIGDKEKNNGVLLLAALSDRSADIVLGLGLDNPANNQLSQEIMQGEMIPRFRAGDPGGALLEGARACARRILDIAPLPAETATPMSPLVSTETPTPPLAESTSPEYPLVQVPVPPPAYVAPEPARSSRSRSRSAGLLWVVFALGLIGSSYFLMRAPRCGQCRIAMTLVGEREDDAHLTPAEKTEERVGAVDHQIWLCPQCGVTAKRSRAGMFSGFSRCSHCSAETVRSTALVIESPTYSSTGTRRVDTSCAHCGHATSYTTVIPCLEMPRDDDDSSSDWSSSRSSRSDSSSSRSFGSIESSSSSSDSSSSSSSSSSSGFGGGSSSGGGASGSW